MSKGTFLEQQQMYRVLFKVQSVQLRLREEVDVQVVIKKGQQNFIIPHRAKLINSIATLNAHAQFFVSEAHPIFDVMVMILHGQGKKFAGMCQVNLNQWQQNSNNQTTSMLLKSPDANATIIFNFMYLTSDVESKNKELLSLPELESKKRGQMFREMQDKYTNLTKQNSKLHEQVHSLRAKNSQLLITQEQRQEQYNRNCEQFQEKIKTRNRQMQNSESSLLKMREKMQKIEEMVNSFGQEGLKKKMEDLFLQFSKKE